MSLRVEGFAIVSEDGMVADASGNMPTRSSLQRTRHFCLTGSTMLQLLFMDGIRMRIRQDHCEGDV